MSPAVTRRRALATSAAAALGLGTALGTSRTAAAAVEGKSLATAPVLSAEAKALQAELGRLSSAYRRACREADEASERVDYPDPPEAIYEQPGDRCLFMRQPDPSWSDRAEGRDWWADAGTVDRLRADTFRRLDGEACQAACARRDEIVAAIAIWRAADQAAEDVAGYSAAQDRFDAASLAYRAFRARLVEMRTDDTEVLIVKGMAIVDLCNRDAGRLNLLIERAAERDGGAHETAMALSMARDFIGLFGHSAWVSA